MRNLNTFESPECPDTNGQGPTTGLPLRAGGEILGKKGKMEYIPLMEEIRLTSWYGKYSIIYRVNYTSRVVVWDFFHQ